MADETTRKELRKRLADPAASVDAKQDARRILASDDVFEECPGLYDAWDRIETMLMKEAIKIEERRSEPFEGLVAEADAILSEVAIICDEEDSIVARAESDRIICETLNITDAIDCLRRVIHVGKEHPNALEQESSELLADAIRSRDPLELWDGLTWVRENLINRNECIRLLMREAEMVLHFLLELALQERYVKMRPHMSRAERRLFQFMHRRSPELNGRIPAIDEIGRSFVIGLDAENAELFLEVIGYGGTPEKNRELSHRWKSYLRLYPFWCELMQFDDREEKRRRSTHYITPNHEYGLADTSNAHDPHVRLPRSSVDSVDSLAQRYCTDTQQRYLLLAFVDRQSHTEIAERFGVSQQAVSKSIGLAMKRIREGLVADRLVELAGNHRLVDETTTQCSGLSNSPFGP